MALQLVDDKSKGRSSKSKKKRKSSITKPRKYEKLPAKELIPNFKFVEKNKLNEFLNPSDWFRAFIPESQKKGDPDSVCVQKWCFFYKYEGRIRLCRSERYRWVVV